MTKREKEFHAFRRGFQQAKAECLLIIGEWSRACHPIHPKKSQEIGSKDKCWQHHCLQAARRSIDRDVVIKTVYTPRSKKR